ncbi:MAG TPA: hypothetical protein VGL80_00895 [Pseudonocardiaceae bacterium]
MTVALEPARRRLVVQAAVGLACVAIVVVGLWIVAGYAGSHNSATSGDRRTQATVTTTASCVGADTQDGISFTLDGSAHQAKLDGCGHQKGEAISVLVPAGFANGAVLEPSDAAPGDSSGVSHRVAFILLIVATVVGGLFGYRFFRTRGQRAEKPVRKPRSRPTVDEPDDEDYHSEIRPAARNHDPDATGVDWFEDSSAHMSPVPPPADLPERADRT